MSSFTIAIVATFFMIGGTLIGFWLARRLPDEHLSEATKDIVKLSTGILATIAGLVLSLLIATAKNSYDAVAADVKGAAASFIMLDRTMAYLPHAEQPRRHLREALAIAAKSDLDAAAAGVGTDSLGAAARRIDLMVMELLSLKLDGPGDEWLRQRALSLSTELARARWMLQQEESDQLPGPFVAIVVLWLAIIFAGFGLFTPANLTAMGALVVGAISISASLFLINELNTPFYGIVKISSAPLVQALEIIGPLKP